MLLDECRAEVRESGDQAILVAELEEMNLDAVHGCSEGLGREMHGGVGVRDELRALDAGDYCEPRTSFLTRESNRSSSSEWTLSGSGGRALRKPEKSGRFEHPPCLRPSIS